MYCVCDAARGWGEKKRRTRIFNSEEWWGSARSLAPLLSMSTSKETEREFHFLLVASAIAALLTQLTKSAACFRATLSPNNLSIVEIVKIKSIKLDKHTFLASFGLLKLRSMTKVRSFLSVGCVNHSRKMGSL